VAYRVTQGRGVILVLLLLVLLLLVVEVVVGLPLVVGAVVARLVSSLTSRQNRGVSKALVTRATAINTINMIVYRELGLGPSD